MISISHSRPTISAKDTGVLSQVLKTHHLAQGKKVLEFERAISGYCKVSGGVAVSSGTSALHLSLLSLNIGPGDEVILPSFVCSAPLNAIQYTGARARIVDVDGDTFNISALEVKKHLNKKTKAVIVPHMFGLPADLKALLRLGVPVIEDCAQALGASYQNKKAGSLGLLSICSFYATKLITTGEGGMVLSDDSRLLEKIRDLRQYDHVSSYKIRFNYKMTEMQAALGLSQFSALPDFLKRRKHIAQAYDKALANSPVTIPFLKTGDEHIYYRYVIKVSQGYKNFMQKLKNKGVDVSPPVFKPLHRYFTGNPCPVADELMRQCVSIPIYPSLTEPELKYITRLISCI